MPNIRLILEYNGAAFHGWQFQPGLRTIEGELKRVLSLVLREEIQVVYGSGRTDSGVHARGQVANFRCQQTPDLHRLIVAVSSLFRGELAVLDAAIVDDAFHSRLSAIRKQYSYHMRVRPAPPTFERGGVWHVSYPLDLPLMRSAAAQLIGTHDFTSLRGGGCGARSPIKEIFESDLILDDTLLVYRVVGRGFLKQMVRNIVGTLIEVGRHRLRLTIPELLALRDRSKAGPTAPPWGLFLDWVGYPSSDATESKEKCADVESVGDHGRKSGESPGDPDEEE